ncbi:MAG: twin-arginine translocase TatA/TatE family subunit [Candidatus Lindowbacteria bacterium]|nr:twin-arginine translocase TatA/TatE family subunit [Candidatus Lindowbacteria bacterium]
MPLGYQELLVILVIALVVFGASRVPEIFRAFGSGIGEFKKGLKEGETEADENKESSNGNSSSSSNSNKD